MYDFIDITELQSGSQLPSEALCFNGNYLEDLIQGYRTLYVSGREVIGTELKDMEIGNSNGSKYRSKRYPARSITVGYQLIAKDNSEFRKAYNKLNAVLETEEAKLIFNDEKDKYFIGTARSGSGISPGSNRVTGEIEFYCADPFKYSVEEKVAYPTLDDGLTFGIDYQGTHKSFPVLEATMNGENGFVGYVDKDSHVLQFGNVEEVDGEDYKKSQTLIDDIFTSIPPGWLLNTAIVVGVTSEHKQVGAVGIAVDGGRQMLVANNYGGGVQWHGPSLTKKIPADANGHIGSQNCTLEWHQYFTTDTFDNLGVIQISMTDKNKKNVVAISFFKNKKESNECFVDFYANGKKVSVGPSFNGHYLNDITGYEYGRSSITKFESYIEFNVAGKKYGYIVPELQDIEIMEISTYVAKWGESRPMYINGICGIRFQSHSVNAWRDIPNKFAHKDMLSINCTNGEIRNNNIIALGLGALGNDWESFCLTPGTNQIKCLYSGWAEKPTFKLTYREVFL